MIPTILLVILINGYPFYHEFNDEKACIDTKARIELKFPESRGYCIRVGRDV